MPLLEGDHNGAEVQFGITEWWDHSGTHYDHAPTPDELLEEATQITVHIVDSLGNDLYFTDFSPDGWTDSEIQADVDDAYGHYV